MAGDGLLWLFRVIVDDGQPHLVGLANVMDEFQRLIDNEPKQRERISSWFGGLFGDLALVAELTRQLDLFQPRAAMMNAEPDTEESEKRPPEEQVRSLI